MFYCGMYRVEWYNKQGKVVKNEEKYLNFQEYGREIMLMQTKALQGMDVESLKIFAL